MDSLKVKLILFFTLLFWASAFVGIRIGLTAYTPGALALLRFLVASGFMYLFKWYYTDKRKISWAARGKMMLLGVAGISIYNICLNTGEMTVSAGVASFIIGLIPVFTIILSIIFLKERPRLSIWIGVIISFIGLFCILQGEEMALHSWNYGVLIILVSTLMGSFYNVCQKYFLKNYDPVTLASWVIWGGTIMLLWFAPDLWHQIQHADLKATTAAVYMGIFPAALAYIGWSYILDHLPASLASMSLYTLPIFSTLMGLIFLNEQPSILSLSGGVLALMGAICATMSANDKSKPLNPSNRALRLQNSESIKQLK